MSTQKFIVTVVGDFGDGYFQRPILPLADEIQEVLAEELDFPDEDITVEPFDEDQQSSKPAEDGNQSLNQTPKENN